MRSLPVPEFDAVEVFRLCNSRLRREDLKSRMAAAEPQVGLADAAYRISAAKAAQYAMSKADFQLASVSKDEMIDAYEDRLVNLKAPGRKVYETLRLSSETCPLCNEGAVAALDHYLPKVEYPALAVNPNNLVPICSDCNKAKSDSAPSCAEEQALHPYYDRIDNVQWLHAEIVEVGTGVVLFDVAPPDSWDELLAKRVRRHFRKLGLGKLYSNKAGVELDSLSYELGRLLDRAGELEVRESLKDRAEGRSRHMLNSWQAATYTALAKSVWYYSGGFRGV